MNKIINYKKFTSKNGNACLIVTYETEASDFEFSHGLVGHAVKEEWIPVALQNKFTPDVLGKNFIPSYTVSNVYGKPTATICDIAFK